jgi:hypothetical protein
MAAVAVAVIIFNRFAVGAKLFLKQERNRLGPAPPARRAPFKQKAYQMDKGRGIGRRVESLTVAAFFFCGFRF